MRLRPPVIVVAAVLLAVQAQASESRRVVLKEGRHLRQIETDRPAIDDLLKMLERTRLLSSFSSPLRFTCAARLPPDDSRSTEVS